MKKQQQMILLWVIAVTIAGTITGYLEGSYFQFAATLVFSGLLVGTAQYMVLRQTSINWHWIVVTAVGWVFGAIITIFLPFGGIAEDLAGNVGMWEVFWLNLLQSPFWFLPLALGQWWLLRNYDKAFGWIGFTLVGGTLQGAVSALAGSWDVFNGAINTAFVYGIGWFAYAVITAIGLYILNIGMQKTRA